MIPISLEANMPGRRLIALHRRVWYAKVHNYFNAERHLVDRQAYEHRCSTALAEWQSLAGLS